MLEQQALSALLHVTLGEYSKKVDAKDRVEQATALVELATAAFCTVGVLLDRQAAVVLAARMMADIVAVYERGIH